MPPTPFSITIHMVASLDGYIAKKDNSTGWFETTSPYEKGVTGEDPTAFLKTIDCYLMGARTYEHAIELSKSYGWAYGDTPTIVVTHRKLPILKPGIELYSGELETLVSDKLKPNYKNVWMVGGAQLAKTFLQKQLVHEIRMPILPILLGDGLRFFDHTEIEHPLKLKDVTAYKNGMVELRYEL